ADLHRAGFASDRQQEPVQLAVDLRVQHALRDELIAAREKYKAKASAGLVLDVRTGEVIAMVSEPDYNPNNPREALDPNRINRITTGVYEMGSTFKALTVAMALDSGKINLNSSFDARMPLRTELPESAEPIVPKRWGELNTVTIAFGHGLSVAPLQSLMGVGALMNGGLLIPPTFLKRTEAEARSLAKQVVKPETSALMRY